jgi:ProP effector
MGFEQLAELKKQLAAQAKQTKQAKQATEGKPAAAPTRPKEGRVKDGKPKAAAPRAKAAREPREPVDPLVESIWRLQKQFPLAFPKKPAAKVPLKLGILKDAALHLEALGMTDAQLQQAIATWCQGSRYWACLVENAERVDLQGQASGTVTAQQAAHARRLASRRPHGKRPAGQRPAADSAAQGQAADAAPQPDAEVGADAAPQAVDASTASPADAS